MKNPCTLHTTQGTLHTTPCTLHTTPCTLHTPSSVHDDWHKVSHEAPHYVIVKYVFAPFVEN